MTKIRFKGIETVHSGTAKKIVTNRLLVTLEGLTKTKLAEVKKSDTSLIEVLTEGKKRVIAKYEDYATVFLDLENGFILSNDGTVYSEPEESQIDIEQVRNAKLAEVGDRCENTIYAGIDVQLADGSVEHISLKEKDQINLFGKQAQLASGADKLEYHEDGQPCKYYSPEDMQTIITAALQHVSFQTTYCNSVNMWIKGAETEEEIKNIEYGCAVPEKYQSEVLKDYLAAMEG